MDTLQERLGVAVESDAARFSGGDFAEGRGASVARRVRRRRTARAAGYGGGAMLAVGALAVGGARLPWGGIGAIAQPGAGGCVTPDAAASTVSFGPEGGAVVYSATVDIDNGQASVTVPGRDSFTDPDVPPRYVVTYESDGTVHVVPAEGEEVTLRVAQDAPAVFVGSDGRAVTIGLGPHGDVMSVVVEAQVGDILPVASPSPSSDCVTPEPTDSASPAPSLDDEVVFADASPFQCGFVFDELDGSTGVITFEETQWVSSDEAAAAVRALHEDPASIPLGLSGEDVPVLTYSSTYLADRAFYASETGPTDPDEKAEAPYAEVNGEAIKGGFVEGAQFVLVSGGVVVATYDGSSTAEYGVTQYIDPFDIGSGKLYGLDLTLGFAPCTGVDPSQLEGAQPVAVAGTKFFDSDGNVDGPYYAWRFITRG